MPGDLSFSTLPIDDEPPSGQPRMEGEPYQDRPDAFGLGADDWVSLASGDPEHYTHAAMLWWALAGVRDDGGPVRKTDGALHNLLASLSADARGLMAAARSARDENVNAMAGALDNLCRRLDLAAQIADALVEAEIDRPSHREKEAPRLPAKQGKQKRASR